MTGRYSAFRLLGVVGACVIALGSCKTVPLPNSPEESLFIIPYTVVTTLNNKTTNVLGATMTIKNQKTGHETTVRMPSGDSFAMVPLEPGAYDITEITITMKNGNGGRPWTDLHAFYGSFFLERDVVRYYERSFYVSQNSGGWYRYGYDNMPTNAIRTECLRKLKRDPHWLAWQNYTLVNF